MFSPGYQLYPVADGSWRYAAPGEKFVRVSGPERLLRLVRRAAAGAGVEVPPEDAEAYELFVSALRSRGVVGAPDAGSAPPSARVHVTGENPVGDAVAELLRPHAEVTTGAVDEQAVAAADVLVSVAGWLPDSRWREVDRWCTGHDTAWHRCHAEGTGFALGPFFLPGRTASYRDTRARRLAACPVADELLALWNHLDGDEVAPVRWPRAGGHLLAGLLAEDVLAWLAGDPVPTLGHQLFVEPGAAEVTRHPVLPLPDLAERPAGLAVRG
jgi:hypothetical protein